MVDRFIDVLKKKGVNQYELYYSESYIEPVKFDQNVLQSLEVKSEKGLGIRVIQDGKVGFTATNDFDNPEPAVERALAVSKFGKPVGFEFPSKSVYPEVNVYEPTGWPTESRIELGRELIDTLVTLCKELRLNVELNYAESTVRVVNSSGLDYSYQKTGYTLEVEGLAILETGITWIFDWLASANPIADPHAVIPRLRRQLEHANKLAHFRSGKLAVIFAPLAFFMTFVRTLSAGLSGKSVVRKITPLLGKEGEKVLGESFTLWDDGTMDWMYGSRPFDDEGVPTTKRKLIDHGVLQGFVFDLDTAAKAGKPPTGNAVRDYTSTPTPGFNNMVIEAGNTSIDDMIKDTKRGILIYGVIGGGQSNVLAGDFSVNVGLGFLIDNGEIVGRVKDTMVAGNFYELFRDGRFMLSKEQQVIANYKLPYAYVEDVMVATKS